MRVAGFVALVLGFVASTALAQEPVPSASTPGQQVQPATPARGTRPEGAPRAGTDAGLPAVGATVTAQSYQYLAGARRLTGLGSVGSSDRADDHGSFRLFGLPPGQYIVTARSDNGTRLTDPGIVNTEADAFAPTHYPGTANIAEAVPVTVRPGRESAASFGLVVAHMAKVRGQVISAAGGAITRGFVTLQPDSFMSGVSGASTIVNYDGSFSMDNVPPGRYRLVMRPPGLGLPDDDYAAMPLTVGADDMDGVVVTAGKLARVTGVVMTDDGSVADFKASRIQIFANPSEPRLMLGVPQSKVHDDFTFEITGLLERQVFNATAGAESGWYLKSVYYRGDDVTDTGVEFETGRAYDGFEVVFTRKVTDLSGLVLDDRGRPVVDATVVVFSADRGHWNGRSRLIRTSQPDTSGRYQIKGLPPRTDYMVIAVQGLENGQANDAAFLARAIEEATRVTLAEGETKALDVKLSGLVP